MCREDPQPTVYSREDLNHLQTVLKPELREEEKHR